MISLKTLPGFFFLLQLPLTYKPRDTIPSARPASSPLAIACDPSSVDLCPLAWPLPPSRLKFPSLSEWLPSGKPSSEPGPKAPKGVRRQPVSMPMLTLAFARRSFRVSRRIKKIAGATSSSSSSHRCYGKHRVLPCGELHALSFVPVSGVCWDLFGDRHHHHHCACMGFIGRFGADVYFPTC